MSEEMTDKQMEVILNLVADKFAGCKDMDEVKKAIEEVRNMAKKEKPNEQDLGDKKGGGLAKAAPIKNIITRQLVNGKQKNIVRLLEKAVYFLFLTELFFYAL